MVALPQENPLYTTLDTLSDAIYSALTNYSDLLAMLSKISTKPNYLLKHFCHTFLLHSLQSSSRNSLTFIISCTQPPTLTATFSNTSSSELHTPKFYSLHLLPTQLIHKLIFLTKFKIGQA
eukprot:Phypoly_transcript_07708.p1 GENE.Phypoly_transcript_07708~~Phypoly_transcript_07708.p1  ORF type:complete len:121 (-),score=9.97 Phypoly_transcript_07708:1075-1437(-)